MRSVARRYLLAPGRPDRGGAFRPQRLAALLRGRDQTVLQRYALTLVAFLLAAGPRRASDQPADAPGSCRLSASVGVWFSHPLALVLGGVGTYLVARGRASAVTGRRCCGSCGVSLLWAGSFAACFHGFASDFGKGDPFIWNWWDFAFLPLPPRSLADLSARLLASAQYLQQSLLGGHAAGRARLGVCRVGFVPVRRAVAGFQVARRMLTCWLPRSFSRSSPRGCISIRFMDGCFCF